MSVSILVVDDEPDVADLFRQRFRRETRQGTDVMHFASGAEALDRLAEEIQPTLIAVLSDINIPGIDGLQLLHLIKPRFPDLPVMMVTADGDEERRRLAAEYGAAEFITKPIDFDKLKEQLRQLTLQRTERACEKSSSRSASSTDPGEAGPIDLHRRHRRAQYGELTITCPQCA
jgi:CheY-like chemotaxis protein